MNIYQYIEIPFPFVHFTKTESLKKSIFGFEPKIQQKIRFLIDICYKLKRL